MSDAPPHPALDRWKARGALGLVGLGLLGLLWVAGGSCQRREAARGIQAPGDPVKGVRVRDAQGHTFDLASLRGKVVLVDVWATWCPPCRASLPEVAMLQKTADEGYAVVAISLDKGGFEDVRPFLAAHPELGIAAVVPESRSALAGLGDLSAIPTTLLLDREGRVLTRWRGYHPGRAEAELKQALGRRG